MESFEDYDRAKILNIGKNGDDRSVPFLSPDNEIKVFGYLKGITERTLEDSYVSNIEEDWLFFKEGVEGSVGNNEKNCRMMVLKEKLFLMWVVRWCDAALKFWVRERFEAIPGVVESKGHDYEEF